MTLVEFLEARIAEDEAVARDDRKYGDARRTFYGFMAVQDDDWGMSLLNVPPARILAECEAKRAILDIYETIYHDHDGNMYRVLRALALPYADHPDYRQEWRESH